MVDARAVRHQHADGRLRDRGAAGGGSNHDSRPLPLTSPNDPERAAAPLRTVTVYHAAGCHLCDRAIEAVTEARERHPFNLELADIGGDAALEAVYREQLPVIEIDGIRAFTYFVSVDALLGRLGGDGSPSRPPEGTGNM